MKILKTVLIMLLFSIPIFAQNGDIVLKINGHEHSLDFSLKGGDAYVHA